MKTSQKASKTSVQVHQIGLIDPTYDVNGFKMTRGDLVLLLWEFGFNIDNTLRPFEFSIQATKSLATVPAPEYFLTLGAFSTWDQKTKDKFSTLFCLRKTLHDMPISLN